MIFKKQIKCNKCQTGVHLLKLNFNGSYQKGKVFGMKGTHKITMVDTSKGEKFVAVKDIDKLSDLDYEILGRAFVNRLYSPYYDRYDCPCLEDFCENVCQQTEGELFAKNIEAEKNLE